MSINQANRTLVARRDQSFALQPLAAAVTAIFASFSGAGQAATCTWNPATGNWGTGGNWSCAAVPGASDTANIAGGLTTSINTAQSILNLNNAGTINIDAFSLNLVGGGSINNAGGFINIANGATLTQSGTTLTGGTISTTGTGRLAATNNANNFLSGVTLNGTLDLATANGIERVINGLTMGGPAASINVNANSQLAFEGTQSVSGTGNIVLGATGSSNRVNLEAVGTTTLDAGITIRGQNGTIGGQSFSGGAHNLVVNGLISADVAGGTIILGLNNGTTSNNGVLEARNGATLQLNSAVSNGAGGHINALTGSTVLQNGVTISGGTIGSAGTGALVASNSGSNVLNAVTLTGNVNMASATGIEQVTGGLTMNGGSISINANSVLVFSGSQTVGGSGGTIVLGSTGASNRIGLDSNGTTTLGNNIVIRGQNGTIGPAVLAGGTQSLVNNGRISADVSGGTINLSPNGGTTNNGILEAQNGGTLLLSTNVTGGGGGQIIAGAGSTVRQNGVTLSGTINGSGSGILTASNAGNNFLDGVTLNGNLNLAAATGQERVINGLTLNGEISVNANSVLTFEGTQNVNGNGTIVLGSTGASNRIGLDSNGTTTLGNNIVIRGQNGTIGPAVFVGGTQSLINNGRISADVSGGTINLSPNGGTTNNGILEAQNGGTLLLSSNVTGTSGSQILAGAVSTVRQNGVTLSGTINTSGGGIFSASNSSGNFLDGVTLNGDLNLAAATGQEQVINGLTLNGTISVNANSVLTFQGTQNLAGNGSIVLGSTGASNRIGLDGTGTTTIGSGVTIRGQNGTVGPAVLVGGTQSLINNGLVSADVAGGTIGLGPNGGTTNNAVLDARNGGTLRLDTAVNNSASGQINAQNASTVLQNGVTIAGGTIGSSGTGALVASNNTVNVLNGVTLSGNLNMASATGYERVTGGLTMNGGTISVNANSVLALEATQTIGGTGTITLGSTGASNRITLEGANTTTIGSGVTINGQNGTIGGQLQLGGAHNLINNGNIVSSASGLITVNPSGTLTNNGLIHAQVGTITLGDPLLGTGTLQVGSTGLLNLANGGNVTGNLVHNGNNAGSLNVGTGALTVSGDYSNANFGVGNLFNARANVAGTGLINAVAGTTQAIGGTGVGNGATIAPTLAIGNVRVGTAATQTFTVDNTGTGATLRGAIQTSVGGAAISDARLTVTPQNFGPVAAGSSSAPVTVTFNAASAGLITLAGTNAIGVVNNYANVANQLISITTAPGAAAYNIAQGSVTPTVVVANQRVGGTTPTAITVSNIAPGGAFTEKLNASFGTNAGQVTNNGGTATLVGVGAPNSTSMAVGVDTSAAGARSGTVTVNFQSDGNGTSGLSAINVGSGLVNVSGNVYQLAQPSPASLPTTVNLGNFRAGSGAQSTNINVTNNNIAPAGFQEGLNALVTAGAGTTASGLNNLAAGAGSAISVGLAGIAAGVNTGTVAIQYQSNGAGTSGLSTLNLGAAQNVTVNGTGYRLAATNTQPAVINFGNVLIGSSQSQFLDIQNTAAADGFSERLDSRFQLGGTTGHATNNGGSISLLGAGASNMTAMSVGINTSAIGTRSGQVVVAYDSNGSGTSGLGITNLPNQTIGVAAVVTGTVGTLAQPSAVTPNPVNFGAVRIGSAPVGPVALSITNNAVIGEGLNASAGAATTGFSASGSFNNLGPGATNSSALQVQFTDTGTAGAKTGTATIGLVSDGTFNGGVTTSLASQAVNLSAEVYRLANPTAVTPNITLVARVGDAAPSANVSITNGSPDTYTEALKVTAGATPAGFTVGTNPAAIAAQGTGTIQVGLNTASAGSVNGNLNLANQSSGAGTTGAADVSIGNSVVALAGKVYTAAVAQINTALVNFGIVHVGDAVSTQNISIKNNASATALNDVLQGSVSASGPFSITGNLGAGLGAQQTGDVAIGVNTATAGIFSVNTVANLASHNPDMVDLALAAADVELKAQINNYANAAMRFNSGNGSLTQSGNIYTLDFGNLLLGSGSYSANLGVLNDVVGPVDVLAGSFNLLDAMDFSVLGFTSFAGLGAGQGLDTLFASLDANSLGMFSDTYAINAFGSNAGGYNAAANNLTLILRGNVIASSNNVPEPGSLALVFLGSTVLIVQYRRRSAPKAKPKSIRLAL